jgi:carbon-monoxide dehydrogenase medium subunit
LNTHSRHLPEFDYFEPKTLGEAIEFLSKYGNDAKVLAGGTDLLVDMKLQRKTPKKVVNIQRIPNLTYIRRSEGEIRIGSLTTLRSIEKSDIIKEEFIALFEAAHLTGSVQVRNMGTIGGNLCTASPSADVSTCIMALDAKLKIIGSKGERICPIKDFFIGPKETVLKPDELLTEVQIPRLPPNTGTAFQKMGRISADLAKVNAAVKLTISKGICENVNISIGSCAPTIIRAAKAEGFLKGKKLEEDVIEEAANIAVEETKPITDIRSTEEYRRHVSRVLVRRVIQKAQERAGG